MSTKTGDSMVQICVTGRKNIEQKNSILNKFQREIYR